MLDDLVTDWGGFEKLVAALHETGDVTVEHNVTLIGRSSATRQIDVLLRHRQGLYEHLVIIECKWRSRPVKRQNVDALAQTIHEVGAARGVIFSRRGFQSGAIRQAGHEHIDLFQVRELTDEEWGQPGRIFDLFLQTVQPSIGNPNFRAREFGPAAGSPPPSVRLDFEFGPDGPLSETPLFEAGVPIEGATLEQQIMEAVTTTLDETLPGIGLFNSGAPGTYYACRPVNLLPNPPFELRRGTSPLYVDALSFDLGIRFDQSRITHDRAQDLQFVLAIENLVTRSVSAASRAQDAPNTTITPLKAAAASSDAFRNGMLARIHVKGMFAFEELNALTPAPFAPQPFVYRPPSSPPDES